MAVNRIPKLSEATPEVFAPMKGAKVSKEDEAQIKLPVWASNKEDGIRGERPGLVLLSASSKLIPNPFIRDYVESRPELLGADGELIVLGAQDDHFDAGPIMRGYGKPDFEFRIFDLCDPQHRALPFERRLEALHKHPMFQHERVKMMEHVLIKTRDELREFYQKQWDADEEGFMTRHPKQAYKMGKCSLGHQGLLKFKFRRLGDAIIVGFYEMMKNGNAQKTNEQGRSKRSSHKENLVPKGTLGGLVVRTVEWGEFNIGIGDKEGIGLDDKLRKHIWDNRDQYLHSPIEYSYQKKGMKDKPRQPALYRFRHLADFDPATYDQLKSLL